MSIASAVDGADSQAPETLTNPRITHDPGAGAFHLPHGLRQDFDLV